MLQTAFIRLTLTMTAILGHWRIHEGSFMFAGVHVHDVIERWHRGEQFDP